MDLRIPEEYESMHTDADFSDSPWDIDMTKDIPADALSYNPPIADILLVKEIDCNDPRAGESKFLEIKAKMISGLKKRKIRLVVNSKQ